VPEEERKKSPTTTFIVYTGSLLKSQWKNGYSHFKEYNQQCTAIIAVEKDISSSFAMILFFPVESFLLTTLSYR
jgi:hypothetical protein